MASTAPGMSTTLFRLIVDQPLKLKVTVPKHHRGEIKVGQTVGLDVESHPHKHSAARWHVNPSIDRANRTFQIEILIPNDGSPAQPRQLRQGSNPDPARPVGRHVPEEAIVFLCRA